MLDILRLIPTGRKNAISCRDLERLTGANRSTIAATISRLRRQGVIICASLDDNGGGGYYIHENLDELKAYALTEQMRIHTATAALQPALDELERLSGV